MIATNLRTIALSFDDIYDAIEYKLGTVTKQIGSIPSQIVQINGAGGYTPHPIASPSNTISSKLAYLYNLVSEIKTCIIQSGVNVTGMSNYAAAIRSIGAAPAVHTFAISGLSTITGETAEYLALYDNASVSATWLITAGNQYATISNGEITILSGANNSSVTIQASYNGLTATKTITITYESGTSYTTETETETTVDPQTGATTETTTTTVTTTDGQGNTTTSTVVTETTTNQDGSSSTTEAETINNSDGSSTSSSTTTNYDENGDVTGSTTNTTNVASDGSSNSSTTNYDENGDPTDTENVLTDVEGNVDTQDIVYDENGDPTVTAYTIDTTNNPDGGKDITGDGVNTGFYPFDGSDGFELHIRFRSVKTEQPNPPIVTDTEDTGANYHFTILCSKSPFQPWPGFHIRWTLNKNNYSSGNIVFGYKASTGSSTNRNLAISKNNNVYDYTIAYDPLLKKYPSKFRCQDNLNGAATISLNVNFEELNYGFTLGYNINQQGQPYRYSNVEIYEFTINKL